MKKVLVSCFIFACIFSSNLLASTSKTLVFKGQVQESVALNFSGDETRFRDQVVDSTCTRQVPNGTEQVCEEETRYRQDCQWTRESEECHYGDSEIQCHESSPEIVCNIENGRRICRNEPGRRICETVPGRRICTRIPSEYICHDIPYSETVCHNETTYETQSYACKKTISVPYTVKVNHAADIDFTFVNTIDVKETSFDVIYDENNDISLVAKDPSILVFAEKQILETTLTGNTYKTSGAFKITLLAKEKVLSPVKAPADKVELTLDELEFVVGKVFDPSAFKVTFTLFAKSDFFHRSVNVTKTLTAKDLELVDTFEGTSVKVNFKALGISIPKRKYDITIDTSVELNVDGEVVNDGELVLKQTKKVTQFKVN